VRSASVSLFHIRKGLDYIIYEVYNRPYVHPALGWDASKSRNGAVHPMAEFLLYTSLTCQQSDAIMLKIEASEYLDNQVKVELIDTVKESAPQCDWYWDAND